MAEPRETHNQKPGGKLTRRQLAAAVSASAVLLAQPATAQPPAAPLPQNPDEELKAARDQNRQSAEQLAKFSLPMATEPAVHFQA